MDGRRVSRLLVVAGLGFALAWLSGMPVSYGSGSPPVMSGKRWVTFNLEGLDASGEVPAGQPANLSITVGGVAQTQAPLVAICESVLFERQIVMLEPDSASGVMSGTAALTPIPQGKFSVIPKVARVQVTFARSHHEKFERVMTRVVYVTLGPQTPLTDRAEDAVSDRDEAGPLDSAVQEEVQPDVEPMAAGRMVEEDLMPLPTPGRGRAYWQHVSGLVSRSWSRTVRRVRHSPSSETVRVRFRLYPSGRAQLIQIEKGSGAREIDEAGIFAVVHAQPFPPFPDDVGSEPMDVHVRMRTGPKLGGPDTRSVTNAQPADPSAGAAAPKK
jgi:TonB family protein